MKHWVPTTMFLLAAFSIMGVDYVRQAKLMEGKLDGLEMPFDTAAYFTSLGERAKIFLKGEEKPEEEPPSAISYVMLGAVAAGIANTANAEGGEELLSAVAQLARAQQITANGGDAAELLSTIGAQVSASADSTQLKEQEQLATALEVLSESLANAGVDAETSEQLLTQVGNMAQLALQEGGDNAALLQKLAVMADTDPEQLLQLAESFGQLSEQQIASATPGSRDVAQAYISDSLNSADEGRASEVRCTMNNGSRRCRIVYLD